MIDVQTHMGRVVANTDEDAIAQYTALAKSQWDDWREDILKKQIMDRHGKLHQMPDPGPFPIGRLD